jgi:hypothetical protein
MPDVHVNLILFPAGTPRGIEVNVHSYFFFFHIWPLILQATYVASIGKEKKRKQGCGPHDWAAAFTGRIIESGHSEFCMMS